MKPDIRRAVIRTTMTESHVVSDVSGEPLVFSNPSDCVKFLNMLRDNQRRSQTSKGTIYVMVALDDPTYKKLTKEKRVCQHSH